MTTTTREDVAEHRARAREVERTRVSGLMWTVAVGVAVWGLCLIGWH